MKKSTMSDLNFKLASNTILPGFQRWLTKMPYTVLYKYIYPVILKSLFCRDLKSLDCTLYNISLVQSVLYWAYLLNFHFFLFIMLGFVKETSLTRNR